MYQSSVSISHTDCITQSCIEIHDFLLARNSEKLSFKEVRPISQSELWLKRIPRMILEIRAERLKRKRKELVHVCSICNNFKKQRQVFKSSGVTAKLDFLVVNWKR